METERLFLRAWMSGDFADLYEYSKLEGIGMADTQKTLDGYISGGQNFAVVLKERNKVIGSVGFGDVTLDDDAYKHLRKKGVGYCLSREYWGRGIMTEAVRAVIDWLFDNTDTELIFCGCSDENTRSRRVIEKCNFTFIGTETFSDGGEIINGRNYVLLRENYCTKV